MDMFIKMHRSGQNFPDKVISIFWVLAIHMVMVIVMHGGRRMLVMIYDICKWRLFTNECTDGDNMWSYLSRWWWRTRYWRRAWTTLALSMSSSELCTCLEDTVWSTCENVKGWVLHIPSSEKCDSPDGKNFFFELVLQRIGRKDLRPRPWKIILQRL